MNKVSNRNRIRAGQILVIPVRKGHYKLDPKTKRASIKKRGIGSVNFGDAKKYTVRSGDTLWSIATNHKTSPAKIKRYNPKLFRRRRSRLYVGESLQIPNIVPTSVAMLPVDKSYLIHKVRRGENLTGIARRYKTSINDITSLNKMSADDLLKPGDTLKIKVK